MMRRGRSESECVKGKETLDLQMSTSNLGSGRLTNQASAGSDN